MKRQSAYEETWQRSISLKRMVTVSQFIWPFDPLNAFTPHSRNFHFNNILTSFLLRISTESFDAVVNFDSHIMRGIDKLKEWPVLACGVILPFARRFPSTLCAFPISSCFIHIPSVVHFLDHFGSIRNPSFYLKTRDQILQEHHKLHCQTFTM